MSGFSQFVGAVAGQVASRMIMNKVANVGLGQREPGYKLPIPVPEGVPVERQPAEAGAEASRFKIPNWMFFTGYGALLWYAAKATAPVEMPALGAEPESDLLFPGLNREITSFDIEDVATSDDPVEACLERAGWKLPRIDELRQSIFEKEQVDLFTEAENLTRSEGELLEAIESCMQKLEAQYGSLESAGVACSVCDGDDPDLGAAEIKETREDWIARHEAPGDWRYMWQRPGEEPKQVSADKAYDLNRSTAPGKLYLLRATSANAARILIATGRFTPVERRDRKSPKVKHTEPPFYPGQQSLFTEPEQLDLMMVQREMFDPEQQEIDFDPVPDPEKIPRDRVDFLLNQYLERVEPGQEPTIDGATLHIYGRTGKEYKEALLGYLRLWGFKNWTNFKASMKRQSRYATGKAELYEYLDNLEPGESANVLDACNWILGGENCTSTQIDSLIDLIKLEGYFYIDDLRKAYKLGDEAKIPAHRKTALPLSGDAPFTFDGTRCRDAQGNFVPVAQCRGRVVGRDEKGKFVSMKG